MKYTNQCPAVTKGRFCSAIYLFQAIQAMRYGVLISGDFNNSRIDTLVSWGCDALATVQIKTVGEQLSSKWDNKIKDRILKIILTVFS